MCLRIPVIISSVILSISLSVGGTSLVFAQEGNGQVVDSETGYVIPYTKVESDTGHLFTAFDGKFNYTPGDHLHITHPLYESSDIFTSRDELSLTIKLKYKNPEGNAESELAGLKILEAFQQYAKENNPENLDAYEFLTNNFINTYERSRDNTDAPWTLNREFESYEKNRYKFRKKYFHKLLNSKMSDSDTSDLKYIPINTYTLSPYNEFIRIGSQDYLNPLHKGAKKKYIYSVVETFIHNNSRYHILFVRPKEKRLFLGFRGLYYINEDNYGLAASVFNTMPFKDENTQCVITYQLTKKNIWIGKNIYLETYLNHMPTYNSDMKLELYSRNSTINFDINDQSSTKWLNMIALGQEDSKFDNESWSMSKMELTNSNKLSYIKTDTTQEDYIRKNWIEWINDIYMGRVAYRLKYVDLKNIISINQYEYLRIGLGIQTRRQFSDFFTMGGNIGYGFRDKKFKYGYNVGINIGKKRSTTLSYNASKDILEPGRTEYIEERKNYLRNFFSKRMDDIRSSSIQFKTALNRYMDLGIKFNSFNLEPNYSYTYLPILETNSDTSRLYFSEVLMQLRIGQPHVFNPNTRRLFYANKTVFSSLYINLARGYDHILKGDYSYWKLNSRLLLFFDFNTKGEIDLVVESGIMTPDQPYQTTYIAPGNDVALAGITIKNAFQTMELYQYISDRYFNAFFEYTFGSALFKKTKFNPQIALALNMGWGIYSGNPDLQRGVEIHDYGTGYLETGLLINNLLKIKVYKYFYGGLGVGVYYALKNTNQGSRWAFRLTYKLGSF